MNDLSLVPIEELADEIFNRCDSAVLSYHRAVDSKNPVIFISHCGESTLGLLGLCDMARDKIQREFNKRACGDGEQEDF